MPDIGYVGSRYFVYSVDTQTTRELVKLPSQAGKNEVFAAESLDWTRDGNYLVGATFMARTDNRENLSLAIVDISQEVAQVNYFSYEDEFANNPEWVPFQDSKWSYDGDWIAYRSSNQSEAGFLIHNFYVVNRDGIEVARIDPTNIVSNLGFAWIR